MSEDPFDALADCLVERLQVVDLSQVENVVFGSRGAVDRVGDGAAKDAYVISVTLAREARRRLGQQ